MSIESGSSIRPSDGEVSWYDVTFKTNNAKDLLDALVDLVHEYDDDTALDEDEVKATEIVRIMYKRLDN
jgi:hypothetical protein